MNIKPQDWVLATSPLQPSDLCLQLVLRLRRSSRGLPLNTWLSLSLPIVVLLLLLLLLLRILFLRIARLRSLLLGLLLVVQGVVSEPGLLRRLGFLRLAKPALGGAVAGSLEGVIRSFRVTGVIVRRLRFVAIRGLVAERAVAGIVAPGRRGRRGAPRRVAGLVVLGYATIVHGA